MTSAQVEDVYLEALTQQAVAPAQVEDVYLEVLHVYQAGPATATLVERKVSANTATPSFTLTSTPAPGDTLVVIAASRGNGGWITGVTGMGATWSKNAQYGTGTPTAGDSSPNASQVSIWVGVGATTSGAISVTLVDTIPVTAVAYLVRAGGTTVTASATVTPGAGVTGAWAGPSTSASQGQFVIDYLSIFDNGSRTWPSASTPASGWVVNPQIANTVWSDSYDAYRAPAETSATPHQLSSDSGGAVDYRVHTQTIVGDNTSSPSVVAAATLSATSTLTSTGTTSTPVPATAALAATSTLAAVAAIARPAAATLVATSTLTATADPSTETATVTLTSASTLAAAASVARPASAALSATASLASPALVARSASATSPLASTLSVGATVINAALASLSSTSGMIASASATALAAGMSTSATSSLAVSASNTTEASASLGSSTSMSLSGNLTAQAGAATTAASGLIASGSLIRIGEVILGSSTHLSGTTDVTIRETAASLNASSSLVASPFPRVLASAQTAATSRLSASGASTAVATTALVTVSGLDASSHTTMYAVVDLSTGSGITVSGIDWTPSPSSPAAPGVPITVPFPTPDPAPIPAAQATVSANPYYLRDTQGWAIAQERQRNTQALYAVGEYAMFALMWHQPDFEAGLVGHCPRCSGAAGSIQARVQDVYRQPTQTKCPDCYGTTFEGGVRALIVRPAIFSDADQGETKSRRGVVEQAELGVESTSDFLVRNGDYVFRSNGDRYYLRVPSRTTLRTGFWEPSLGDSTINYNHSRASLEDPTASVAYRIGPTKDQLASVLSRGRYAPQSFATDEVLNGPLIPEKC